MEVLGVAHTELALVLLNAVGHAMLHKDALLVGEREKFVLFGVTQEARRLLAFLMLEVQFGGCFMEGGTELLTTFLNLLEFVQILPLLDLFKVLGYCLYLISHRVSLAT